MILKNIEAKEVLLLRDLVSYAAGQVVSKTLVQNHGVGITLFAFAKGEGISTHASTGDAVVTALDGQGRVTIDGEDFLLQAGETIVMPAGHPSDDFLREIAKVLHDRLGISHPTIQIEMAQIDHGCAWPPERG